MQLEVFAEMQRHRVRAIPVDRRRRLKIKDAEPMETRDEWPMNFRSDLIASADPIRAAYKKMGIVYE